MCCVCKLHIRLRLLTWELFQFSRSCAVEWFAYGTALSHWCCHGRELFDSSLFNIVISYDFLLGKHNVSSYQGRGVGGFWVKSDSEQHWESDFLSDSGCLIGSFFTSHSQIENSCWNCIISFEIFIETDFLLCITISIDFNSQILLPLC